MAVCSVYYVAMPTPFPALIPIDVCPDPTQELSKHAQSEQDFQKVLN